MVICAVHRDVKQDPVVYGAEFGGSVPCEGSMYCIHTVGPWLPQLLLVESREKASLLSGRGAHVGTA